MFLNVVGGEECLGAIWSGVGGSGVWQSSLMTGRHFNEPPLTEQVMGLST